MKKIAILLLLSLGTSFAFAQNLKTQKDSLSYAYGVGYANYIGMSHLQGETSGANFNALLKGLEDALNSKDTTLTLYAVGLNVGASLHKDAKNGLMNDPSMALDLKTVEKALMAALKNEPTQMTTDEANMFLQLTAQKKQEEQMEKQFGENRKKGEDFLAENKKKKDVKTTPSGLQYEVITLGKGEKPTATNQVKVHYRGTLIDGTEFDSSYGRGEPAVFGVNQVIGGWTEALQLMPVGSKFKLYIPQNLAYGAQGAGGQIPPYSMLIFEVELLEIVQ